MHSKKVWSRKTILNVCLDPSYPNAAQETYGVKPKADGSIEISPRWREFQDFTNNEFLIDDNDDYF